MLTCRGFIGSFLYLKIPTAAEISVRISFIIPMYEPQLSEIALECGFSSQAHLTAVLGKAYVVTPGYLRHKI